MILDDYVDDSIGPSVCSDDRILLTVLQIAEPEGGDVGEKE